MDQQKEPEESSLIFSISDLIIGTHVRLRCKCEGFVIERSSGEDGDYRYFKIKYTSKGCGSQPGSLKEKYSAYGFSSTDVFHPDSFGAVLPALPCPPPEWFPSLEEGPKVPSTRAIVVKLMTVEGMVTFSIPSDACSHDPHYTASAIRSMMSDDVRVEVVEHGIGKFEEMAKGVMGIDTLMPPQLSNELALRDWLVASLLRSSRHEMITVPCTVPMEKEKVVPILKSVSSHPAWKNNAIRVDTSDQMVASLSQDGKVI